MNIERARRRVAAPRGPTVLVVEDDEGQARLTIRSLRRHGYEVEHEATGGGSLARLQAGGDYVVLLDLGLPDMHGLEVLEQIVARSNEIPVIVVTGVDDIKIAVEAIQKGAWDYVVKRVELSHLEELPHVISRNLDRQRLVHERNLFLSMLSHDIKNPVQVILSYADFLLEDEALSAEGQGFLSRIKHNADSILRLVRDFGEARKIEAGRMVVERAPLELASVLQELAAQQEGLAATGEVQLGVEVMDPDMPELHVDRYYIERAVTNLLSNAIKYTPPGGTVTLRLCRENDEAIIEVLDTGAGIPEEDLPYVFDKYRRVRGTLGEGTGLGLYIVRSVAEAHGGRVSVESSPGQGTRFTIRLPFEATPSALDAAG